jgi:hypothetical protein
LRIGRHIDGHFQIHGDSEFAVRERVDADDFGEVLRGHGIVRRGVGKRHKNAHAFVIVRTASNKVDAVFWSVYTGREIFKVVIARLGRAHAHGPGKLGATSAAKLRIGDFDGGSGTGLGARILHFFQIAKYRP